MHSLIGKCGWEVSSRSLLSAVVLAAALSLGDHANAQAVPPIRGFVAAEQLSVDEWPYPSQMIGPVSVQQIGPTTYMLTVEGVNVGLQTGPQGSVVVNSGPQKTADALLAAIKQLSSAPIRYVINTGSAAEVVGGNGVLAAAGQTLMHNVLDRPAEGTVGVDVGRYAMVVAYEGVPARMLGRRSANYPSWAIPGQTFSRPQYDFFMNGEAISVIAQPAALSADNVMVRFQRSDVVVTGEIFDPTGFPRIDLENGGSIQGEIDALNRLLNQLTFSTAPMMANTGGTLVIPMRGPVSDQQDVMWYRNMVGIIRDRVATYISEGMTLEQVLAADPTQGYRTRYGSNHNGWTAERFVEAVYKSLQQNAGQQP